MLKKRFLALFTSCLALVFVLPLAPLLGAPNPAAGLGGRVCSHRHATSRGRIMAIHFGAA